MKEETSLFAELVDQYPNGSDTMYVYAISGNAEEIQAYEEYKGTFLRHDSKTGLPLYYTKFFKGNGPLRIREATDSKPMTYFIDDSAQQKVIMKYKAQGLDVEKMLAEKFARELDNASKKPQVNKSETPAEEQEDSDSDLGGL